MHVAMMPFRRDYNAGTPCRCERRISHDDRLRADIAIPDAQRANTEYQHGTSGPSIADHIQECQNTRYIAAEHTSSAPSRKRDGVAALRGSAQRQAGHFMMRSIIRRAARKVFRFDDRCRASK